MKRSVSQFLYERLVKKVFKMAFAPTAYSISTFYKPR